MKPIARAVCVGLLAGSLVSLPCGAQTAGQRITAVRFWSLGDVTRVAIETDGLAQYHVERIENPDRLFVDLPGLEPARRGVETIPVNDRLVRQIRVARSQPGVARVVIDLAAAAEYSVSQLAVPDRVIVELRLPATAPAPAARIPEAAVPTPPAVKAEPAVLSPAAAESRKETKVPPEVAAAARIGGSDPSLTRALGLKLERVVIDPGHGGHDTGTVGRGGLAEKDLVLDVARRLGTLVAQRLGSEVVYTRSDDTFVPLETRTDIANERKADLFLSIHANSSRVRATAGSEVYYLNFSTSADALEVAARENATSQRSVYDLQSLVEKIARKEKVQESREFASMVQKSLFTGLSRRRGLRDRGVKKAPFVVLIGARMPSVLAEIDFLSNPREESLLKRGEYRQRIAEALYKGVAQYANTLSHFQVAESGSLAGRSLIR